MGAEDGPEHGLTLNRHGQGHELRWREEILERYCIPYWTMGERAECGAECGAEYVQCCK